ncbi:MAG TPA: cytochrome-c peroxidase [Polyangiaceae bacterium]|jgi:cytochrome c553|nr:cytochrome-c peroxidase [Polyangiaceae bacterium]
MTIRKALPFFALGMMACGSITDQFGGGGSGGPKSSLPGPSIALPSGTPLDSRPVQSALTAPPPISGGTLLVNHDGSLAIASDPDRDRVSVVRIDTATVLFTVALLLGDEPGRLVEDAAGRVHVALRRGGALVTIDTRTGAILARRAVCGAPRGLAYDAGTDQVHVACATGELVSFPAAGGDAVRRLKLDVDLRDVIVRPTGGLFVSRFKSGELLAVDANGHIASRAKLHGIERESAIAGFGIAGSVEPIEPAVAWRTIGAPDGTAVMLHQYGLATPIKIGPSQPTDGGTATSPTVPPNPSPAPAANSPYGTPPGGCGGLVQPAISQVSADGSQVTMGQPIVAGVLSVDAALSPDSSWLLIAHAGLRDAATPSSGPSEPMALGSGQGVTLLSTTGIATTGGVPSGCLVPSQGFAVGGQVTAVAFNPSNIASTNVWFAVQTREPATLSLFQSPTETNVRTVQLGGDSVFDTGHDLFHRDAGGGIACASCHAEGGEDGRVWRFDPIGDRRTQAVHVGLKGTEPFHWDGDMTNFGMLVDEVMVRRMGGSAESDPRKVALQNWLFSLTPPAAVLPASDAAAVRGKAIFESAAVGCASCHTGPHLSTNQTVYVGTTAPGHLLQIPSLHGIAYRAPYLHDGCAATLRDRFDPGCGGGDLHGHTSQLGEPELTDLVAYLETL